MTRLHRCSPYRIEYDANTVRCADCGRTWLRDAYRYRVISEGKAPGSTNLDERRKAAVYE